MVWLQYCTIELVKVGSSCSVYEAENGRGGGVLMKLKLIVTGIRQTFAPCYNPKWLQGS